MNTIRETGEKYPTVVGQCNDMSRREAMRGLLDAHELEIQQRILAQQELELKITVVELPPGKTFLELLLEGVRRRREAR